MNNGQSLAARPIDEAIAEARRHTKRVTFLKKLLPALAAGITIGFVIYSWLITPSGVTLDLYNSGIEDGKLVMASPSLDGFTSDNLPYKMTADRAIQDFGNMERVTLENISAAVPITAGNIANIAARSGHFDNSAGTLDITTPLTVVTQDGMEARLQDAAIDVKSGSLRTDKPVAIMAQGNKISADSLAVSDSGKVLVFENRVRMTLKPRDDAKIAAPGGNKE